MPRPKLNHLKVVGGQKDPRRLRPHVEDVRDFGEPPEGMSDDLLPLWHEIADGVPGGVLSHADRHAVELACRLLWDVRNVKPLSAATATQFRLCLTELAMTPSARARIKIENLKPKNSFADLDD